MSDIVGKRETGSVRRQSHPIEAIVQRLTRNFNVTSRSVEMAAKKFYTDAKFGCLRQSAPPKDKRRLGIQRLSATKATR